MLRAVPALMTAVLVGMPAVAFANSVVLAPLLSRDTEMAHNATDLLSAELDFQPGVDKVIEIGSTPSNNSCLSSSSCLNGLVREGGGDQLITGAMSSTSDTFTLDLVYYDAATRKTIRRKTFTMDASPMALADGMTAVVRELLTGTTPEQEEEDAVVADSFDYSLEDSDEFAFEEPDPAAERAAKERRKKEDAARRAAEEEEARRRAEEQARIRAEDEARRKAAEDEARRQAEQEEARRQAEEDEKRRKKEDRQASNDEPAEDFDPSMISFSSATSQIKVESAEEITFARPSGISVESDGTNYGEVALGEDEDPGRGEIVDIDGQRAASRDSGRSKREKTRTRTARKPAPEGSRSLKVTARAGYSKYFQLGFITYGGEIGVPLGQSGAYVVAGVEGYSVNRTLPPEWQTQLGRATAWDTIIPFNAGLHYELGTGGVRPYLGADFTFAQYFYDEEAQQRSFTWGLRGRLGADFMLSKVFGLNINGAMGFWKGDNWEIIDTGVKNTGVLPQVSAGTVFSF